MGWGSTPSGTLRFKKIDGSFWNGETFRFADYKMKDFIKKWGGALNCCTWTVSEDMSKIHHNTENDNRYKSIIEKYQNDSNSVCFDEIQFLGDYYPRKIENVSKELDRLYYGF